MPIVTTFTDGLQETVELGNRVMVAHNKLDFSATPVCSGDIVEAIKIPAGAKVMEVHTTVKTAEGSACTATVGDATDSSGWDASVDLNAAVGAGTRSLQGTDDDATEGKYYATADTIDLTMGNDASNAVFLVSAVYHMLERY